LFFFVGTCKKIFILFSLVVAFREWRLVATTVGVDVFLFYVDGKKFV
jgi:hypothetical protein